MISADEQIIKWVRQTREAGFDDEHIKKELIKVGWAEEQIMDLLSGNYQLAKPQERKPKSASVHTDYEKKLLGVGELFSYAWDIFTARLGILISIGILALVSVAAFYILYYYLFRWLIASTWFEEYITNILSVSPVVPIITFILLLLIRTLICKTNIQVVKTK